jgi:hypothetical protein
MKIDTWILTFNRQKQLNRLIGALNAEGIQPNVFSNHPLVNIDEGNDVDSVVVNTLNNAKSNSWCARSWNSIFIKAFYENKVDGLICIQDDTMIKPGFLDHFMKCAAHYDFIHAPAGDQFFYLTLDVLRATSWWDERYIGCYAGDCDFFKRAFLNYDKSRISNFDTHQWGWKHNVCGIEKFIDTELATKMCGDYENQHWEIEKITPVNKTLLAAQAHYHAKWGCDIDSSGPAHITGTASLVPEIQWYPSMAKELRFNGW